jgi:hypothetical protein
MRAEDFLIDNGSYRKAVKAVGERLPELDIVATLAFIIKPRTSLQIIQTAVAHSNP